METLRLLALQYDMVWENKKANKNTVERMLSEAPQADLILLPEMFDTGFTMNPQKMAEPPEGDTLSWIRDLAKSQDALICGSWPVRSDGGYFNRMHCVYPSGHCEVYDKRHLFSYGGEDKFYRPGRRQTIIEYKGWRIQAFVCYDLRFPVWMRNSERADLYLVPANWPDTRVGHWSNLLRARAIENQVYLAGVNRIGKAPNGLSYNGGSAIIDYAGHHLSEQFDSEEVLYAELKRNELRRFRSNFPFLEDRDPFLLK
jgi:predicted amidohydrolase